MATSLWDEIIVTDANREAFELIRTAYEERSEPRLVWIYGPAGCGKSTAAANRARERDLLSPKRAVHTHAQEIMLFVQLANNTMGEQGAPMLERIGVCDILFLDAFEVFFERGEENVILVSQLLDVRSQQGLDTYIISDKAPEELDLTELQGTADGYQRIEVAPLDEQGRCDLARALLAAAGDKAPALDDEALDYIALEESAENIADIRSAIRFLVEGAGLEPGEPVSKERVIELLS